MGFSLYIMVGYFVLLMLYVVLALFNIILQSPCIRMIVTHLRKYLFWNGFIRLFMELYQGLCVASVLNTYTADDDLNSAFYWVRACYYCRIVGMCLVLAVPIIILVPFYCIKRN